MIAERLQKRALPRPGLTITKVGNRYDVSPRTITEWVETCKFPPANVRLNARRVYWSEDYLEAWEGNLDSGGTTNGARFAQAWRKRLPVATKRDQDPLGAVAKQVKDLTGA